MAGLLKDKPTVLVLQHATIGRPCLGDNADLLGPLIAELGVLPK